MRWLALVLVLTLSACATAPTGRHGGWGEMPVSYQEYDPFNDPWVI